MVERHPFGDFVPKKPKYLMLGSFPTKPSHRYDWFYANGRNQFWPIMEEVYGLELRTKEEQQELFSQLDMALADIILACERRHNSNLDVNLFNLVYNIKGITAIITKNRIKQIFFTSRYVETIFRKHFKDILQHYPKVELVCLPSPSPRYAMMTKQGKVKRYKELLPNVMHKLLQTGNRKIIEDSPKDSFWGWGESRNGRNELGKIWMRLRDEVFKQQEEGLV